MSRGPIPDRSADRPTVPEVFPLALQYVSKPGNEMGGNLHIVLDDQNLDDGCIAWCREHAESEDGPEGAALAEQLLAMTGTQRRKLHSRLRAARY